jgi:hypothetical protein
MVMKNDIERNGDGKRMIEDEMVMKETVWNEMMMKKQYRMTW